MKKIYILFLAILSTLVFTPFSSAQPEEEGLFQAVTIKLGVGFEYFSRTLSWDEEKYDTEPKLKSYFFTFNTEFELKKGFSLSAIFGYSFSDYYLIFRELDFSIELESGGIGGYLFGGEIKKSIIYTEKLEIDGLGQFYYYLGTRKEWEIPGLAVEGTVDGKSRWMRASIGPVFTYTEFDSFHPYLSLSFNKLWGSFKMDQTVQDLERSERKKTSGKGSFCTSLGVIYKLTDAFSLKAEANFFPYKNLEENLGVNLGFMFKAMYSF